MNEAEESSLNRKEPPTTPEGGADMAHHGGQDAVVNTKTAAILLAAGPENVSRNLLTSPLGDSTVVQAAAKTLESVISCDRIVVVIAEGDTSITSMLGDRYIYAVQDDPQGTGHAVAAARNALPQGTERVLVAYADTPLLRPESLAGLLNRHRLIGADLSLLTAVVDDPKNYGRIMRDNHKRIAAILEASDID